MSIVIRDVQAHELDSVLALNNAAGDSILPLDAEALRFFYDHAAYFRIAEVDGHLGGFLIALGPDTPYQSPNFLWFKAHEPDFIYIDRVVVAPSCRGAGVGRVFYADVESFSEVRAPLLTCEVFIEPGGANDVAMLFHGTFGFNEVGQQVMPNTGKHVSLLAKPLPSYGFVRDTYLAHGDLPDVEWLRQRDTARPAPQRATGT